MKKGLCAFALGLLGFVTFLAFYISSAVAGTGGEYYSYGHKGYLILAIICLIITGFGGYSIYQDKRGGANNPKVASGVLLIDGLIGFAYFLGDAIEAWLENEEAWWSLALFVFFFVMMLLGIYGLIASIKKGDSPNQ